MHTALLSYGFIHSNLDLHKHDEMHLEFEMKIVNFGLEIVNLDFKMGEVHADKG